MYKDNEYRSVEYDYNLWISINSVWWMASDLLDAVVNYMLVANEVNSGIVPFEKRRKLLRADWRASEMLTWPGRKAETLAKLDQSLDRIAKLEEKIKASADDIDNITRVVTSENYLILKDLVLGEANKTLVEVDELKLSDEKIYALTGPTGCGKSSILSKIKGVRSNKIAGRGAIYYPAMNSNKSSIVMVSQQDYFPVSASLREIIFYPKKPVEEMVVNWMHACLNF